MITVLILAIAALLFWASVSQAQNTQGERGTKRESGGSEPSMVVLVVGAQPQSVVVLSQGISVPPITVLNFGLAESDPRSYYESQIVQTRLLELQAQGVVGSSLSRVRVDTQGAIRLGTDTWG